MGVLKERVTKVGAEVTGPGNAGIRSVFKRGTASLARAHRWTAAIDMYSDQRQAVAHLNSAISFPQMVELQVCIPWKLPPSSGEQIKRNTCETNQELSVDRCAQGSSQVVGQGGGRGHYV